MVPATTLLHRTNVLGRRRRAATKEEANRRQADSFLAELCSAVGTGGARGARAPPIFGDKGTKSTLNFICLHEF